jgi:hypothetical protein
VRLIWYQRQDGLWNAACACNATVVGVAFNERATAEEMHFEVARTDRAHHAPRYGSMIPPCGPKLPEPNPNEPGPRVFP